MIKKTMVAWLVAMAMLLAACSPSGSDPETEGDNASDLAEGIIAEISVQAEADWVPYYEKAIERVKEKNPEATINVVELPSFDHLDTIDSTDATNPDVADVFALPADRIYGMVQNEVLSAIDSQSIAKELGGWTDFDNGIGGNFKINEEYFAFPYNIETLILFVNKANAEAAGIDYEKPMEVNDMAFDQILIPVFDAWYGVAVTNSSEIELLEKDGDQLRSDLTEEWSALPAEKQATMESLFNYWKANYDAKTSLFDEQAGWGYIDTTFTSGNNGVVRIDGPWATNNIAGFANDGEDLAILPLGNVTMAGKPLMHWQSGWGLGINSRIEGDADQMALAQALIAEIVNPEHAVELFQATGKILENVPAEQYADSDLAETDKVVIAAVIESYQNAPARPLFSEWGQVWDSWKNAVLSWNSVQPADAESAYQEIKASFDAMMKNY